MCRKHVESKCVVKFLQDKLMNIIYGKQFQKIVYKTNNVEGRKL